ncbi:flavin-dependent dehydrogenase [Methanofollis sp. W23]|uniref:NAD(P)/FAD-dependent oxidoreductase n=1 Tax=Methanofollis sp. W23 TaxID=2817849 RepID=UPI001AEA18D5|nr:NAD(P)-binding protein [Methanofollis sp. W23]MBP2145260.1 flavin-dependent dehydrogenase [Methanofollis sp. W23]
MDMIRILGAGPAGLAAAVTLARAGHNVEVYEKQEDVGTRFRGDLQGLENWSGSSDVIDRLGGIGIRPEFEHRPYARLSVSDGQEILSFACQKPAFYLVRRGKSPGCLDHALKEQALDAGVDIRFNSTLPEDRTEIVATGPERRGVHAVARGYTFSTSMDDLAYGLVNSAASRNGYAYLLVMNGRGCLCTMLTGDFEKAGSCLAEAEQTFSELVDLDVKDPHPCGGVGRVALPPHYQDNGRLYAGEAAGLQDPFWGFGILYALRSGHLAAQSIIKGFDYGHAAEETFGDMLKAGVVNRYLWDRYGMENYAKIYRRLKGVDDPLPYLRSFYTFNTYQRLLYRKAKRHVKTHYGGVISAK